MDFMKNKSKKLKHWFQQRLGSGRSVPMGRDLSQKEPSGLEAE
jgi:hypothetical protein